MPAPESLAAEAAADVGMANDENSLESLTQEISRHHTRSASGAGRQTRCCCGREDCVFLQRSQSMLAELEKDVQTAAALGQALLQRHERMAAKITKLESKASSLESENSKIIEENKELLASLEDLGRSMLLSESRVRELQDELDDTHSKLTRVSTKASRTEMLEAQLAVLESEQQELRNVVVATKEEERAAVARCKKAERSLSELESQVEKIEREHAMERARSTNILDRLEQRRYNAQKSGGCYPTALAERTAVSRFMKEILAENGHLQIGVAELRDMLAASQEEVRALREQVHNFTQEDLQRFKSPLSTELSRSPPRSSVSTVVHHHHYHPVAAKGKAHPPRPQPRKPKKRRNLTTERLAAVGEHGGLGINASTPSAAFARRWSIQSSSAGAFSSLPTSPSSTFHEPSIFDRGFGTETSRPTSADSAYHPTAPKRHNRFQDDGNPGENADPFSVLQAPREESPVRQTTLGLPERPRLQRSLSHESLLEPYTPSPNFISPRISTLEGAPQPSASVTRGVAISGPSENFGSSAYSRLLGLQQESSVGSPPAAARNLTSSKRWFWGWGGKGEGKSTLSKKPPAPNKTGVEASYVDEDLLQASLVDGFGPMNAPIW